VLIAVSLLSVSVATATASTGAGGQRVLRDCLDHNEITQYFSVSALRSAQRNLAPPVKKYTFCPGAISSAIAATEGQPGANTSAAVLRDCNAHKGALTHSYGHSTLHRAYISIPPDVARYTDCAKGIASQIHSLAHN